MDDMDNPLTNKEDDSKMCDLGSLEINGVINSDVVVGDEKDIAAKIIVDKSHDLNKEYSCIFKEKTV